MLFVFNNDDWIGTEGAFGGSEIELSPELLLLFLNADDGGGGAFGGPERLKRPKLFDLDIDPKLEDLEDNDDDDLSALPLDTEKLIIQGVPKQADKSKVLKLKQNLHFFDYLYAEADHKIWLFDYLCQDSQKFH